MVDPFEVEIKNFQSLKSVKIEIEAGINIITGKTNQGKSAVIRAIDCALFNLGDDAMVRGGQRFAAISLNNGRHKMLFCRDSAGKNEKTAYQFDGGPVQKKVGRTQLAEIPKMFNISDVRMQNATRMKLNFWYQNDKPFLMDKTSGQLYEFLSLSSCDKYTKVLKKMVVDMKIQEADINNITTEIDTLKVINNKKRKFVEANKGYDELYVKIITANQEESKLKAMEESIRRIQESKRKIIVGVGRLKETNKILEKVPMEKIQEFYTEVVKEVSSLSDIGNGIYKIQGNVLKRKVLVEKDEKYTKIVEDTKPILDDVGSRIQGIGKEVTELGEVLRILSSCESKKRVLQISESKLAKVVSSPYMVIDVTSVDKSFSDIAIGSIENGKIWEKILSIYALQKKMGTKQEEYELCGEKLKRSEKDLEDLKALAGYCPFCGTVFEDEKLGGVKE